MKLDAVKIDRDRPPPTRRTKIERPWADMLPGDSFFLPLPSDDPDAVFKFKRALIAKAAKKWGSGGYSVRSVTEDGSAGVRVWRVS